MKKIFYNEAENQFIEFIRSNPSRFEVIGYIHSYKKNHSLEEVKRIQSIYRKFDNGEFQ